MDTCKPYMARENHSIPDPVPESLSVVLSMRNTYTSTDYHVPLLRDLPFGFPRVAAASTSSFVVFWRKGEESSHNEGHH